MSILPAGDGRRFRAVRPESDRRGHGRQPWALREGRGRRTRLSFSSFPGGAKGGSREARSLWWRSGSGDSGETAAGKEPNAAKAFPERSPVQVQTKALRRGRKSAPAPVSPESRRQAKGVGVARTIIQGRRWPTIPAGRVSVTTESQGRAWRQPWLSREAKTAYPFSFYG